jgi:hypothetical protein
MQASNKVTQKKCKPKPHEKNNLYGTKMKMNEVNSRGDVTSAASEHVQTCLQLSMTLRWNFIDGNKRQYFFIDSKLT